jgi:hypothetical protein
MLSTEVTGFVVFCCLSLLIHSYRSAYETSVSVINYLTLLVSLTNHTDLNVFVRISATPY